jgi:hypothetical protein
LLPAFCRRASAKGIKTLSKNVGFTAWPHSPTSNWDPPPPRLGHQSNDKLLKWAKYCLGLFYLFARFLNYFIH